MTRFLPILILLFILATILRDDFALTLIYLFLGAAVLAGWWSRKSLFQVQHERRLSTHAFLDEQVTVKLSIQNHGWLPLLWLNIRDELPVGLSTTPHFSRVTGLGPGQSVDFVYTLDARKRGYYPIGPLMLSTGDILGLHDGQQRLGSTQYLTIYPRIIPLTTVRIPSRSPQGTLRHTQPIFEDPTRVNNKREYTAGDSFRQVDWKTSAASGRLLVKQYEASIALETFIFLDLGSASYPQWGQIDSGELAVVIAASLANWISARRQSVGLLVNGRDPLAEQGLPTTLPANRGQVHLMRLLEILARVEMTATPPLPDQLQRQRVHLPWGTSLIVITGQADKELVDELYQARRSGQEAIIIVAGFIGIDPNITRRTAQFGIPLISIANEHDLDIWRK